MVDILKLWAISHHMVDNPKDTLKTYFFLLAPDWLLYLAWKLHGDFELKCEHVGNGAKPYIIMPVEYYKKGKLIFRAKVMLCRDCARLLP